MTDKWLIRLYDADNGPMIAAYYTENPEQNLKTFYFCKEHDISIHLPEFENENKSYEGKEAGSIYEIKVHFGNDKTYCTIDVWLEDIY